MNTFDLIYNLIVLVIGGGFLGLLGNVLNKHHKARHLASGLEVAQKFANMSVARVATDSSLAMGQRRTAVVRELQGVLDKHGYHFDVKRLVGLAEATYQLYKTNGHKIVEPEKTPAPTEDNTVDGPKANNTVNVNNQSSLSSDEIDLLNNYREKKAANK